MFICVLSTTISLNSICLHVQITDVRKGWRCGTSFSYPAGLDKPLDKLYTKRIQINRMFLTMYVHLLCVNSITFFAGIHFAAWVVAMPALSKPRVSFVVAIGSIYHDNVHDGCRGPWFSGWNSGLTNERPPVRIFVCVRPLGKALYPHRLPPGFNSLVPDCLFTIACLLSWGGSVVAQWIRPRTLIRKVPGSNLLAAAV